MIGKDAWVATGIPMKWKYSGGDKPLWVNNEDMLDKPIKRTAQAPVMLLCGKRFLMEQMKL